MDVWMAYERQGRAGKMELVYIHKLARLTYQAAAWFWAVYELFG